MIKGRNELYYINGNDTLPPPLDPETEEDETRHRMTPEYYDQMLAEIKAAGGDKIQAELQRQLDAWLAENPGWE